MKLNALRKPVIIACLYIVVSCNKEKTPHDIDFSQLSKFAWQHIDHRKSNFIFNNEKPLEYDDTTLAVFSNDSVTVITKSISESFSLLEHIVTRTRSTMKGAYSINSSDSTITLFLRYHQTPIYPGYPDSIVSYSSICKVTLLNKKSFDVRAITDPLTVPFWQANPLCGLSGERYTAVKK